MPGGRGFAWVSLAVWAFFAGGCASASIEVKYRGDVNLTIERLYVVVFKSHVLDGAYARFLASGMTTELSGHVVAQAEIVTGLELDASALPSREAQFKANAILTLNPVGGTFEPGLLGIDSPDRYGTLVSDVRYLAILSEPDSGKVIWRAYVRHEGPPISAKERSDLAARQIVMALYHDHLIR